MNETMESGYFEHEPADLAALANEMASNPMTKRTLLDRVLPFLFLLLPVAFFAAGLLQMPEADSRFDLGAGVGALIQLVVSGYLLSWMQRRQNNAFERSRHSRWRDDPIRVRIGPERFTVENQWTTTLYRWSVVWQVIDSRDRAFFFVDARTAILVPRRAFVSEPAYADFVDLAFRYSKVVKSAPEAGVAVSPERPPSADVIRDADR
jgi:hypothetical protein